MEGWRSAAAGVGRAREGLGARRRRRFAAGGASFSIVCTALREGGSSSLLLEAVFPEQEDTWCARTVAGCACSSPQGHGWMMTLKPSNSMVLLVVVKGHRGHFVLRESRLSIRCSKEAEPVERGVSMITSQRVGGRAEYGDYQGYWS